MKEEKLKVFERLRRWEETLTKMKSEFRGYQGKACYCFHNMEEAEFSQNQISLRKKELLILLACGLNGKGNEGQTLYTWLVFPALDRI